MLIKISVILTSLLILSRRIDLNSDGLKPDRGLVDVNRTSSPSIVKRMMVRDPLFDHHTPVPL